jgi:hypothetical protein
MRRLLLALALVALPALAIDYSPQVLDKCEEQGGCALVSRQWLADKIEQARQEGKKEGQSDADKDCPSRTHWRAEH